MMEWLQDIVSLCGQRCSMVDIGQSYEGRKLPVVKVETDAFVSHSHRPRPKIICRHCVDQQTDSLVTEFQPHYSQ